MREIGPEVMFDRIVTPFVPEPKVDGPLFGVAPSPVIVMEAVTVMLLVHVQVPAGI